MFAAVGVVILLVMVFGGFVVTGGDIGPIAHAVPHEMMIIGGAAVGATVAGNSGKELKALGKGFAKVFKGPAYKKQQFLDTIFLTSRLMKMLRTDGPVSVEPHIEEPKASAIFAEYPDPAQGRDAGPPDLRHAAAGRGLVGHAQSARGRGRDGQRAQGAPPPKRSSPPTRCRASPTRCPLWASSPPCSAW